MARGNLASKASKSKLQAPAPKRDGNPLKTGPQKTGKERLGSKADDEQRVDNCKVPPERRGPKPRPDSCTHDGK